MKSVAFVGLLGLAPSCGQETTPPPPEGDAVQRIGAQKVQDFDGIQIFNRYKNVVVQVDTFLQLENGQVVGGGGGSGLFVDKDGHILTNNHVVKFDTDSIGGMFGPPIKITGYEYWIVLKNKNKKWKAELIGANKYNDTALLKAIDADPNDYEIADFGDPDQMHEGDKVYALGAPFGLAGTFTAGTVSVMHQVIDLNYIEDFIQMDCPINPGNSGSPLINSQRKVVGINSATIRGADGMHFAISVKLVNLNQLKSGEVEMPWFGAEAMVMNFPRTGPEAKPGFQDLRFLNEKTGIENPEVLLMLAKLSYGDRHAVVTMVDQIKMPDGNVAPAKKAGLMKADIITSVNGKAISSGMDLRRIIVDLKPGVEIEVSFTRVEKTGAPKAMTVKLKLEKKPPPKMNGGHNH